MGRAAVYRAIVEDGLEDAVMEEYPGLPATAEGVGLGPSRSGSGSAPADWRACEDGGSRPPRRIASDTLSAFVESNGVGASVRGRAKRDMGR